MKRSNHRVLTTHAGRLDGPPELRELGTSVRSGSPLDPAALASALQNAIGWVVRRQVDAGVDIVSDGELGKLGFGLAYYGRRLTGLTSRQVNPGEPAWMSLRTGERQEFSEFYKELQWVSSTERVICSGPIK